MTGDIPDIHNSDRERRKASGGEVKDGSTQYFGKRGERGRGETELRTRWW